MALVWVAQPVRRYQEKGIGIITSRRNCYGSSTGTQSKELKEVLEEALHEAIHQQTFITWYSHT